MGTTDEYYHSISGILPAMWGNSIAFNIIKSAYVLRKGMSAPYMEDAKARGPAEQLRTPSCVLKSADDSTATPPAGITFPSASLVSTGMTNVDVNGASGNGSHSNGVWAVVGAGTDIWAHGPRVATSYTSGHRRLHDHREGRVGP